MKPKKNKPNKHRFRYGEEWYTICITQDDWWIEESISDMPERMIKAANEFALENGFVDAPVDHDSPQQMGWVGQDGRP